MDGIRAFRQRLTPGAPWAAALVLGVAVFGGQARAAGPYDGNWNVTLTCPNTEEGVWGYTYHFTATVSNSVLHGEHGTRNTRGWLSLDGQIGQDGNARLDAEGLTGSPAYTVGGAKPLTPYGFDADAHFDATSGTGKRLGTRRCDLLFVKQ